jgi:uncharacterized protein (TIGR02391 family)
MSDACYPSPEAMLAIGLDPDLIGSCIGEGDVFHSIWTVAERHVRRGDALYVSAGMKLLTEFAERVPIDGATDLLEWHFSREVHRSNSAYPDPAAFDATVAIALARAESMEHGAPPHRLSEHAQRLAGLMDHLSMSAPTDAMRRLASEAREAIRAGDRRWREMRTSVTDGLLAGVHLDPELVARCAPALSAGRHVDALREAMIVLEERTRLLSGLPPETVGERLFQSAFDAGNPESLNPGLTPAERTGFVSMLRGSFALFRNPAAHRPMVHDARRCLDLIRLVDLELQLIYEGTTSRYDPTPHLGAADSGHELRVERVVELDIDGDGSDERVVCYSHLSEFGWRQLHYLVLRRTGTAYRRVALLEGVPIRRIIRTEVRQLRTGGPEALAVWIDRGDRDGELQIVAQSDGVPALASFANLVDPEFPQYGLWFAQRDGLPAFRDADGDGVPEVHATVPDSMDTVGEQGVQRWSTVFVLDADRMHFGAVQQTPQAWPAAILS